MIAKNAPATPASSASSPPDETVPARHAAVPPAPAAAPSSPTLVAPPPSAPAPSAVAPTPPQAVVSAQRMTPTPPPPASQRIATPAPFPAVGVATAQRIATPAPSSTPLDRYSQTTHMPIEVRERIRAMVREAVDESMAPFVRWQKDVEARLERERRGSTTPSVVLGSKDDPWAPLAPVASSARAEAIVVPAGGKVEVPDELDGGRRKRYVGWIIGTLVLILLTGLVSAALTSQLR
ncbi:hypothetical protein [Pendulispora albinea]|uniref:Uncharacterized protein n=1 Tax=Pendulispora albinea TaxID=2741071 RepID=A0ABZ2LJ40_9BACT